MLGNLVRGSGGHPVTFTPAFDLPIMAESHNCQHIDIVVTLSVVSGRQSPPVSNHVLRSVWLGHSCFGDCYAINRWGRRSGHISRFHSAHRRQKIIKYELIYNNLTRHFWTVMLFGKFLIGNLVSN